MSDDNGRRVVDWDRSERGPQRRKTTSGRLLHCCCICGALETWNPHRWSTYCSLKELDDGIPIAKFCSQTCRAKGGHNAESVTDAMKMKAREAEWREPALAYREQTSTEKYWDAAMAQKRQRELQQK
jgi:hypothetical protein